MNFLNVKALFLFMLLLIEVSAADTTLGHTATRQLFWEKEINTAIIERNLVFSSLIPDSASIDISSWSEQSKKNITDNISGLSSGQSLWYDFIYGVLLHGSGNKAAQDHFHASLSLAANDPGATWLLFVEFNRYHLSFFSEQALVQLEKQMCSSGAQTAQIISRHLFHYGMEQKIQRDTRQAIYLFTWSHRFDTYETASILQTIIISLPFNVSGILDGMQNYYKTIISSWPAQLAIISEAHQILQTIMKLFIFFITAIFAIKYLPKALHDLTHLYPGATSPKVRLFGISCIIISFAAFGLIPLFWLITFLLWRFLTKKELLIYSIALVPVIFSPFDAMLSSRFQSALHPDGPLMVLSDALSEGAAENPAVPYNIDNNLSGETRFRAITATINSVKSSDIQLARSHIERLAAQSSSDPVIDNMKGIIHFLGGAIDSAVADFKNVLSYNPDNYCALFNLARCSIISSNTVEGMDYLKQAASISPEVVNTFIQKNDTYFSNNWPLLRQLMFPGYTPPEFWNRMFFSSDGNPVSWKLQWGGTFLGIPPMASLLFFIIFSVILFFQYMQTSTGKKPRRYFECKYCGNIICRKCTNGILCTSCSNTTLHPKASMTLEQARDSIITISSALLSIRSGAINLLVPGAGALLDLRPQYGRAVALLVTSCFIYMWWFAVIGTATMKWMSGTEIFLMFVPPALFHGYMCIHFAPPVIQKAKALVLAVISSSSGRT